jgi:hypothetical protein
MRVKLIDVDNRLKIKFCKEKGIHNFGDDNAYPQLIKSLIGSSVTAKQCVDINSKYIFGKGFLFDGKTSIVNKNGLTLNQLLRIASKEFSIQNNLFFHVNWNAAYQITSVTLIPSTDARIGEADSTGYSGKFILYDDWDKTRAKKVDKKNFKLIDRFNPNKSVIDSQVKAAGGWSKYKGQILHICSDFSETYSLSDGDCVINDMLSEYLAGVYKNAGLRKGYFGTRIIVTKSIEGYEERRDFEEMMKSLAGVEESEALIHLETDKNSDDLDSQFKIVDISSNIDDKMFEGTEESSARNIMTAFGVQKILINTSADNAVFGNSGELLKSAKQLHWENKEEERGTIVEAFQRIFKYWHEPINLSDDWSIIPIISNQTAA